MNRSQWLLLFGALAALGQLICQNAAQGEDVADPLAATAPSYLFAATAAPARNEADVACDAASDGTCACRHFIVNAEAVWLAPLNNQRVAEVGIVDGAGNTLSYYSADAAQQGLSISPRITLGLQGECWGVQTRYWRMQDTASINAISNADATGFVANSSFQAETVDLEVTRLLCRGNNQLQFSAGVRYAQLEQSAGLSAFETLNGGYYSSVALASHAFHGTGLTAALSGVRPVGSGCFNLFYSFRTSLLWDAAGGNEVQTRATFRGPFANSEAFNAATAQDAATLFIGEVQAGGQWNIPLKCSPANAFVRLAFEYQYWDTTQTGEAQAFSYADGLHGPWGVAVAQSSDAHVNLVGFNIGTGLTW